MKFEDLPPMEEKCLTCNGIGLIDYEYEGYTGLKKIKKIIKSQKNCENCKGRGKLLTEFGKTLVQLMKDWNHWDDKIETLDFEIRKLKDD